MPRPVVFNGRLYFGANDGATGYELWSSDGTETGPRLVCDLNPTPTIPGAIGPGSSYPYALTVLGNRLAFFATDDAYGYEIWRSDGTAAGTTLAADLNPGPAASVVYQRRAYSVACPSFTLFGERAVVGNWLFLSADDGVYGRELWVLDNATGSLPRRLSDIAPAADHATPAEFVSTGGRLVFRARQSEAAMALWSLDVRALRLYLPLMR